MTFIIWSKYGYMEFDGNCKENIPGPENYMTFDTKEEAEKYINTLKQDEKCSWEFVKSLKVEQAWWEFEEEEEDFDDCPF